MSFCLPKFTAEKLRQALKAGELDPFELGKLTSEARRAKFSDYLGAENAKQVNTLFETKLLLKNQEIAMTRWAEQLLGDKPETLRDTISTIQRLKEVLKPEEQGRFLEDWAAKKLKLETVTEAEAGKLVDLAMRVEESKKTVDRTSADGSDSRLKYGVERVAYEQYYDSLSIKSKAKTLTQYLKDPKGSAITLAGITKSLVASLDNSFFFRQGMTTLLTHPVLWTKTFLKSWKQIGGELKGLNTGDLVRADILSRENAFNGSYKRSGLAVGISGEEAFPTSLPGRIPGFGRLFKASEAAYNGAALRMRADLMDTLLAKAERKGLDITDTAQLKSMGELVNDMTGRGSVRLTRGQSEFVNTTIFSVRFLKSNINTLLRPLDFRAKTTSFVRAEAAKNLMTMVGSTALTLFMAETLWPGSVDADPRSSNFGKIRIGNTRFDITGGKGSLVTLASRLMPTVHNGEVGLWYKNSSNGKFQKLGGNDFGSKTGLDILVDFATGKASPLARVGVDYLRGADFNGDVPTWSGTLKNLVVPLGIRNYEELEKDPDAANTWISMMAESLGFGVNTYGKK